jgi:hypothetical protein
MNVPTLGTARFSALLEAVRSKEAEDAAKQILVSRTGDEETEWLGVSLNEMVEILDREIDDGVRIKTKALTEALVDARKAL